MDYSKLSDSTLMALRDGKPIDYSKLSDNELKELTKMPPSQPALPDIQEEPGMIESALRGAAQGASFGFADELTGGAESLLTGKPYQQARNESRAAYQAAEKAHPWAYGAGNVGGAVATTALMPAAPATFAGRLGQAAVMGGVTGLGTSNAQDAGGMATDAAMGAGMGAGFQAVGEKVVAPLLQKGANLADDAIQAAASKSDTFNRGLSKVAKVASGVDEDAAMRQIARPTQTAAAEADGFAHQIGQNAVHDTETLGHTLGQDVATAKGRFLRQAGGQDFPQAQVLKMQVEDFLRSNQPSQRGFSAISDAEREQLINLRTMLDGPINGEDLVKVRDYIDHVKRLAGKYDVEETGPVTNFLKGLRGTADNILDTASPEIDSANKAYSQWLDDKSMLRGASNEAQSESMINNLYGANKSAQQAAAGRLFRPDTMEAAQDIAANKAFSNAKGPAGSEYGLRRMAGLLFALPTGGLSAVATSPKAWQAGLRYTGRLEEAVRANPDMFGKYAGMLQSAMQRGPQALAATHFILSQRDPQYRQTIEHATGGDAQ